MVTVNKLNKTVSSVSSIIKKNTRTISFAWGTKTYEDTLLRSYKAYHSNNLGFCPSAYDNK